MIVFKPRGRAVQIVRAGDGDKGRAGDGEKGDATPLGTMKSPSFAVDPALVAKLTPEEQEQVEAHIERCRTAERIAREHAAYTFAETVRLATEWLKTAEKADALAFSEEVKAPFGRLRKHLARLAPDEV